ncbi:alpha/beta hydrolase [Kitasatospora sp. NPDC088134]|uniref:alpha/beta hydrolase n=1 Tax=Kitasatospora sp. NPDC088134 TaxID=3364071 RepID=UPI00380E02F6
MAERETSLSSLDGTRLSGTLTDAQGERRGIAVLVHGAGVTRREGGFFDRLAAGLAAAGVESLRFDLRAHGDSDGQQQEITIAAIANDIRAAADHLRQATGTRLPVHVIAASFSGGAAALHAAAHPQDVAGLVLLNPRLDYKDRYLTSRTYVRDGYLDPDAVRDLDVQGFTERSPFALGRALLNECQHLDPDAYLPRVAAPVLIVHGTKDTFVPIESTRRYRSAFGGPVTVHEIDGSEHGFAVHNDPRYADPQTQAWQAEVISRGANFVTAGSR